MRSLDHYRSWRRLYAEKKLVFCYPYVKKILFLEDEDVLGRIYSKHLRGAGFEVKWVKTTKALQRSAVKTKADGIILDQGIRDEELSGLDIIPALKKQIPNAKIVMLSNYSQFHIGEMALKAGADAYWVKLNTPPSDLALHLQKLLFKKDRK